MIDPDAGYRLIIPVPEGGWLAPREPAGADVRLGLAQQWRDQAERCAVAARVPEGLGPVHVLAVARLGEWQERGIRHHRDVSLVVRLAEEGLVAAGVLAEVSRDSIHGEEIRIGGLDENGGHLVLRLVEVSGG